MTKLKFLRHTAKLLSPKQHLWSLGSNGISALAGLILFGISSTRLSPADFGFWVLFQTISTLFDMFRTGLLLPGYLQISAGLSKTAKTKIFNSVGLIFFAITLIQCSLCWLAAVFCTPASAWFFFFENYPLILISGSMITVAEWWFQSHVRFQQILFLRIVHRMLLVSLAFFLVFDLHYLIYVQVGANIFICILIILLRWLPKPSHFIIPIIHFKKLFHFGKYATPSQLLSNLLRSSDALMINTAMGAAATGIYGAANKFLEFIELPLRSAGAVHFNKLAREANSGKHLLAFQFALKQVRFTTLRILPVSFFLWFFASPLIEFVSGPHYLNSVPVLKMLAIYCLLIPADRFCGLLLEAFGRPDMNLLKVLVMLIFNVAGNVVAISVFDSLVGVSISSIITYLVGVGFGLWLVWRSIPKSEFSVSFKMAIDQS